MRKHQYKKIVVFIFMNIASSVSAQQCKDVKREYQSQMCCGQPNKTFDLTSLDSMQTQGTRPNWFSVQKAECVFKSFDPLQVDVTLPEEVLFTEPPFDDVIRMGQQTYDYPSDRITVVGSNAMYAGRWTHAQTHNISAIQLLPWENPRCTCIEQNFTGLQIANNAGSPFITDASAFQEAYDSAFQGGPRNGCSALDNASYIPACRPSSDPKPDYCEVPWCYVDPTECPASAPSQYFETSLYYSYDTCQSKTDPPDNSWTQQYPRMCTIFETPVSQASGNENGFARALCNVTSSGIVTGTIQDFGIFFSSSGSKVRKVDTLETPQLSQFVSKFTGIRMGGHVSVAKIIAINNDAFTLDVKYTSDPTIYGNPQTDGIFDAKRDQPCTLQIDSSSSNLPTLSPARRTMDADLETGTALIIGPSGEVKCVGNNQYGQCGLDSSTYRRLGVGTTETMDGFPITDLGGQRAMDVAMSKEFSAILLEDGSVTTLGTVPAWVPSGLSGVESICAGSTMLGAVVGGVLHVYDSQQRTVAPLPNVAQISCGHDHVMALDRTARAWSLSSGATEFAPIAFKSGVVSFVAAGWMNSGIIDTNGNVYTWGKNDLGQLGHHFNDAQLLGDDVDLSTCGSGNCLVTIIPGTRATYLSMGKSHSVVTLSNGYVVGFGLDAHAEVTGLMIVPVFWNMGMSRLRRITGSHHVSQPNVTSTIVGGSITFDTSIKCNANFGEEMPSYQVDLSQHVPEFRDIETGELIAALRPTSWDGVKTLTGADDGDGNWVETSGVCDNPLPVRVTLSLNRPFYVTHAKRFGFKASFFDPVNLMAGSNPSAGGFFWVQSDKGHDIRDFNFDNVPEVSYKTAVMGRDSGQVLWLDESGALNVIVPMRREQNALTAQDLQSGLSQEEIQTKVWTDLSSHTPVMRAVVGFTSTYTIMEDYRVVYHGSNDLHGDFSGTGAGNNGGLQWSRGIALFNTSDHISNDARIIDNIDTSWWFDKKSPNARLNPSYAGLSQIRTHSTLIDGSGYWDEVTYNPSDILDKFKKSAPGTYWFSSGALNGMPFNSMPRVQELMCDVEVNGNDLPSSDSALECETSLFRVAGAQAGDVVQRYFSYASYMPTQVVPLGFQQTFYWPDARNGDGPQYLNYLRNEFDGHLMLPDRNVDIAPVITAKCVDNDAALNVSMGAYPMWNPGWGLPTPPTTCAEAASLQRFCDWWPDNNQHCLFTCPNPNACRPRCTDGVAPSTGDNSCYGDCAPDASPETIMAMHTTTEWNYGTMMNLDTCEKNANAATGFGMNMCTDGNWAALASLCQSHCATACYVV